MLHVKRSQAWLGAAILATIPVLAACTVSNDPDGWAPPLRTTLPDGTDAVIARTSDDRLAALDLETFRHLWEFPGLSADRRPLDDETPFPGLTEPIEAQGFYGLPAAAGLDGEEFLVADHSDGAVYAIRRDGTSARLLLDTEDTVIAGVLVDTDQRTAYIATTDEHMYAIDTQAPPADREDLDAFVWMVDDLDGRVWGTPALAETNAHGGILIVPSTTGDVAAIRTDNGGRAWTFEGSSAGVASDVVVAGDLAYFGGFDQRFYALDVETGDVRWSRPGSNWFWTTALVDDGRVYAGDLDGDIWAWDADSGVELWESPFSSEEAIRAQPVLTQAGELVIVTREGTLFALDPDTGSKLWPTGDLPIKTPNRVLANPIILADGSILLSDDQGELWRSRVGSGRTCQVFPERDILCESFLGAAQGES